MNVYTFPCERGIHLLSNLWLKRGPKASFGLNYALKGGGKKQENDCFTLLYTLWINAFYGWKGDLKGTGKDGISGEGSRERRWIFWMHRIRRNFTEIWFFDFGGNLKIFEFFDIAYDAPKWSLWKLGILNFVSKKFAYIGFYDKLHILEKLQIFQKILNRKAWEKNWKSAKSRINYQKEFETDKISDIMIREKHETFVHFGTSVLSGGGTCSLLLPVFWVTVWEEKDERARCERDADRQGESGDADRRKKQKEMGRPSVCFTI